MPIVREKDAPAATIEPPYQRTIRVLIDKESVGASNFVLGIAELKPGERGEEHYHVGTEEAMYVCHGKGVVAIEGDNEHEVSEGYAVFIPSGKKHQLKNMANENLKVVWVYSPPGQESRWKARRPIS